MPIQDSWVETWLERYCAPGTHRTQMLRSGLWGCTVCGKEELVESRTCLICGLPGARHITLASVANSGPRLEGAACGICFDEFATRHEIRGWTVVIAV